MALALSQEALAERAGLSVDAIRALERGRRGAPRADTVFRIVEALALGPDDRDGLIAAARRAGGAPASPTTTQDTVPPATETRQVVQTLPTGGFLGSLPSGPLVARAQELAMVLPLLDSVAAGQGRMILLAGEPGVGKTRLAQELTLEAHRRGFLIAAGRCFEAEQSVPYYPFLDVFAAVYAAGPARLQEEAATRWPYLGALLPNHLIAPQVTGGSDEQQRVLFAAMAYLDTVADQTPLALLLDDLHWADSASLRLLLYLATHARAARILIVATYRDVAVERQHPLHDLLRELSREGLMDRLLLPRLDRSGTAAFLAALAGEGTIADELAELVHRRTEGNPFFAQQVMRALAEQGDIYQHDGQWAGKAIDEIEVPETVRAVIEQRVRRLDQTAQEAVSEASVLGQTFHFNDLAGMTGRTETELEEALDAAERIGLIRETGRGAYNFDHALTQQALYHDLSTRRRRRLHRAAGEAIEDLPARQRDRRTAELAWHFLEGDLPERAIPYSLLAGDQAEAVFAHVEAEHHYRTALRLADDLDDETLRVRSYEKLAAPLHRSGRYDEALEALEQAAAFYERGYDRVSLAPIMAEIGGVHGNRGTAEEGLARLAPVLPRLEAGTPSPALIYVYASVESLLFVLGRRAQHLELAQRSAGIAETLGDTRALAVAKAQLGLALLSLRRREEGRVALEQAITYAEAAQDLATLGHALNNVAYLAELKGEFTQSISLFERGFELAQRLGNPAQSAFMATALGRNHFLAGDWSRARAQVEEAVAISRTLGPSWVTPYPLLGLGRILLAQGDPAAPAYLEEGAALARTNADRQASDAATWLFVELELSRGAPDTAADHLRAFGVTAAWDPITDDASLRAGLSLARVLLALDDRAAASRVAERVIESARQDGELLVLAEALPIHAHLRADSAGMEAAEGDFGVATELCRTLSYPYAEARTLLIWGTTLAGAGQRDPARERLSQGLDIFRRLGARRETAVTEELLAQLPRAAEQVR